MCIATLALLQVVEVLEVWMVLSSYPWIPGKAIRTLFWVIYGIKWPCAFVGVHTYGAVAMGGLRGVPFLVKEAAV